MIKISRTGYELLELVLKVLGLPLPFLRQVGALSWLNCFKMVRIEIGLKLLTWLNWLEIRWELPGPEIFAGVVYCFPS